MKLYDHHVFVCTCPTCSKKDAKSVLLAFRQKVENHGLLDKVKVTRTSCFPEENANMVHWWLFILKAFGIVS